MGEKIVRLMSTLPNLALERENGLVAAGYATFLNLFLNERAHRRCIRDLSALVFEKTGS
jgi:hypothetical protein